MMTAEPYADVATHVRDELRTAWLRDDRGSDERGTVAIERAVGPMWKRVARGTSTERTS